MRSIAAIFFLGIYLACPQAEVTIPSTDTLLNDLRPHPRLMLSNDRLRELRSLAERDPELRKWVRVAIRNADKALERPPLEHKLVGPRLLSVSRDALRRMYALGFAHRWTGESKYAEGARKILLTVTAFKDWNPSHFLDTAEMSHAVGLGYDWFYEWLDPAEREAVRDGLIRNGMEPGLRAYFGERPAWWTRSKYNWNMVCNGGLTVGALALAETHPEYARQIVPAAIESIPIALATYAPDGAWAEGPGYWGYATDYAMVGIEALRGALGSDFGLLSVEGLDRAAYSPIYLTGPTGLYLNFADVGERARRRPQPPMFWLGARYDNPDFIAAEYQALKRDPNRAEVEHILAYRPEPRGAFTPDLDRRFRGPVEVAVFRSAWDDPNALFVGVKAGFNQVAHGHLDLGNFELDALGERWARDLGSDDYNLPGYWDMSVGGRRWNYYRLNSQSHNVPLVGGEGQSPLGEATIEKYVSRSDQGFAIIDFTSAYAPKAKSARRGVWMLPGRRSVLALDEFEWNSPAELQWGMTTDAAIEIVSPMVATLRLNGKTLHVHALAPSDAVWSVESAEQSPPQKPNTGVRRLVATVPPTIEGQTRMAVWLVPEWTKGRSPEVPILPERLDDWK